MMCGHASSLRISEICGESSLGIPISQIFVEALDINGDQVAHLWMLAECQRAERYTLSEDT